jgi:hypothetical protein
LPPLVNLKIDGVKNHERSFLGVNTQIIKDCKLRIYNLGSIELTQSHTGAYIKECVIEVLKMYNIDLKQVISVTSDNAKNMVKSVALMNDTFDDIDEDFSVDVEDSDNDDANQDENDSEIEFAESVEFEWDSLLADVLDETDMVALIRCAAHTLQLAIKDFMDDKSVHEILGAAIALAKKLRTPGIRIILKELKLTAPELANATRWYTTFDMLEGVLKLKPEIQISDS